MVWWPIRPADEHRRPTQERQQIPLCPPLRYYPPRQEKNQDDKNFYGNELEKVIDKVQRGVVIIDM